MPSAWSVVDFGHHRSGDWLGQRSCLAPQHHTPWTKSSRSERPAEVAVMFPVGCRISGGEVVFPCAATSGGCSERCSYC